MAVKIWDAQAKAFKDAEIPMVWDETSGAYKESTGLVYDESASAWNERWGNNKVYLYNQGGECTQITGGWVEPRMSINDWGYDANLRNNGTYERKKMQDSLYLSIHSKANSGTCVSYYTKNAVSLSGYNKLGFIIKAISTVINNKRVIGVYPIKPDLIDFSGASTYMDITDCYSTEYSCFYIDISQIQSNQYINVSALAYDLETTECTVQLKSMWLE